MRSVAVLAIDPTSPLSGGALLGDRLRMQTHATDPGVFIRSMATRGHLGYGARGSRGDQVLDAAGHDLVIVRPWGVGQAEVDVAAATDTRWRRLAGLGDAVQSRRPASLEVADVSWNKADRAGSEVAARDLEQMLRMVPESRGRRRGVDHRRPRAPARSAVGRARGPPGAHGVVGRASNGAPRTAPSGGREPVAREAPRAARATSSPTTARSPPTCGAPDRSYRPPLSGGNGSPECPDLRPGGRHPPAAGNPKRRAMVEQRERRPAARDAQPSEALTVGRAARAPVRPRGPGRVRPRSEARTAGRVPVHPGRLPHDVPRPAVDDAAVRRVRFGRRDQRALPLPARTRPGRPVGRVRHAHADGPRLGRFLAGGESTVRRGDDTVEDFGRCSTRSRSATSRRR